MLCPDKIRDIAQNLDVGDPFYDKNAPGNGMLTTQCVTDMTYAGATRPISFCPA